MDLLSIETLSALFAVGLVAGFVDAIAGGGGLLTLPALLWAGLSPAQALATNKLQSSFGSFSAAVKFTRGGEDRTAGFVTADASLGWGFGKIGVLQTANLDARLSNLFDKAYHEHLADGISGNELRKTVNRMRREGAPIGSSKDGYLYCVTAGEVYSTIRQLRRMAGGLFAAIEGLEATLDSFDRGR